jgi:uncharacterized membrane protein
MIGFGGWWIIPLVGMGIMAIFGWVFFSRMLGMSRTPPKPLSPPPDPLEIARERFAQGLISKEEFDKIAEGLVRTETLNRH